MATQFSFEDRVALIRKRFQEGELNETQIADFEAILKERGLEPLFPQGEQRAGFAIKGVLVMS